MLPTFEAVQLKTTCMATTPLGAIFGSATRHAAHIAGTPRHMPSEPPMTSVDVRKAS